MSNPRRAEQTGFGTFNPLRILVKYSKALFIPILLLSSASLANAVRMRSGDERLTLATENLSSLINQQEEVLGFTASEFKKGVDEIIAINNHFSTAVNAGDWVAMENFIDIHFELLDQQGLNDCAFVAAYKNHEPILKKLQRLGIDFNDIAQQLMDGVMRVSRDEVAARDYLSAFETALQYVANLNIDLTRINNVNHFIETLFLNDWHRTFEFLYRNKEKVLINPFSPLDITRSIKGTITRTTANYLELACTHGSRKIANFLIKSKYHKKALSKDPSPNYFFNAISSYHLDILEDLFQQGISPNEYQIIKIYNELIKSLIANDFSHYATLTKGFSYLIKNAKNPNVYNEDGRSLLTLMFEYVTLQEFSYLLENPNVNLYMPWKKGSSELAINVAVEKKLTEAVLLMYEKGFNIHFQLDNTGHSLQQYIFQNFYFNFLAALGNSDSAKRLKKEFLDDSLQILLKFLGFPLLVFTSARFLIKWILAGNQPDEITASQEEKPQIQPKKIKKITSPKPIQVTEPVVRVLTDEEKKAKALEEFKLDYNAVKKLKIKIEELIDETTHTTTQCSQVDILQHEDRRAQRETIEKHKNECKELDGILSKLNTDLSQLEQPASEALANAITRLNNIKTDLEKLETKVTKIDSSVTEIHDALQRSLLKTIMPKTKRPHFNYKKEVNEPIQSDNEALKQQLANEQKEKAERLEKFHAKRAEEKLQREIQKLEQEKKEQKQEKLILQAVTPLQKRCLDQIFFKLWQLHQLQQRAVADNSSTGELKDTDERPISAATKHYAAFYNLFRCFEMMRTYKDEFYRNTKLPTKAESQVEKTFTKNVNRLRHNIIHRGAEVVTKEEVEQMSMQVLENLPTKFIDKENNGFINFWAASLPPAQRQEWVCMFGFATNRYQIDEHQLVLEDTKLFKKLELLAKERANESKNDKDNSAVLEVLVYETYIPQIKAMLEAIDQKKLGLLGFRKTYQYNEEKFTHDYLFELQALRMLIMICGELSEAFEQEPMGEFKNFIKFCREVRNEVGHDIDDLTCKHKLDLNFFTAIRAFLFNLDKPNSSYRHNGLYSRPRLVQHRHIQSNNNNNASLEGLSQALEARRSDIAQRNPT